MADFNALHRPPVKRRKRTFASLARFRRLWLSRLLLPKRHVKRAWWINRAVNLRRFSGRAKGLRIFKSSRYRHQSSERGLRRDG